MKNLIITFIIKAILLLLIIASSIGCGYFIGKQFVYYDIADCYKGKNQTATELRICISKLRHLND